jgi:hypothetical protein
MSSFLSLLIIVFDYVELLYVWNKMTKSVKIRKFKYNDVDQHSHLN